MRVLVILAHPSHNSLTYEMMEQFLLGLREGGHEFELNDLYKEGFQTDISEAQYVRDGHYQNTQPLPPDVVEEQIKLEKCHAVVFFYPVFWSDAPAKLKGWFDRVWTFGFAYGSDHVKPAMKKLKKALIICSAGTPNKVLDKSGMAEAMKKVMLDDRIADRAHTKEMLFFGGTSRSNGDIREKNRDEYLQKCFALGRDF